MFECDLRKDPTWLGQWSCELHGVWFREDDTPELCPVGEVIQHNDVLDSKLTRIRNILRAAGIPEVVPYPLPEVGSPPLAQYEKSLRAGGKVVPTEKRVQHLVDERNNAMRLYLQARDVALELNDTRHSGKELSQHATDLVFSWRNSIELECPCCGNLAAVGVVNDGDPLLCGCNGIVSMCSEYGPDIVIEFCDCDPGA